MADMILTCYITTS